MFARILGTSMASLATKRSTQVGVTAMTAAALGIFGSSDKDKSQNQVPGDKETVKSILGENIATMIQNFAPINSFKTHLINIRLYSNEPRRQLVTHEYLSHINEDVMQSILMDSDKPGARIVGVEYIITEKLFNQLPEDEKKLWHSRAYEITSGLAVAPGMPFAMEHRLMRDLAPTYGKTFALWHVDSDPLPLGVPQLLVAPNRDGILNKQLLNARDYRFGIDTEKERRNRSDIEMPRQDPNSDFGAKNSINLRAEVIKNTTSYV